MDFNKYLTEFERRVISAGVEEESIGLVNQIPIRSGRLMSRAFGKKIGRFVQSDVSFAIDYYGLIKKSLGFMSMLDILETEIPITQVKSVSGILVHFAAVRIDKIALLAPDLVGEFPWFKKEILDSRGFNHGYKY